MIEVMPGCVLGQVYYLLFAGCVGSIYDHQIPAPRVLERQTIPDFDRKLIFYLGSTRQV